MPVAQEGKGHCLMHLIPKNGPLIGIFSQDNRLRAANLVQLSWDILSIHVTSRDSTIAVQLFSAKETVISL